MIESMSDILSTVGLILVYLTALWSSSAPKIRGVYREIDEWRKTMPLDRDRRPKLQNRWYEIEIPIPLLTCVMNAIFSIILILVLIKLLNTSPKLSLSNSLFCFLFVAQVIFMLSTMIPFITFWRLKWDKRLFPKENSEGNNISY